MRLKALSARLPVNPLRRALAAGLLAGLLLTPLVALAELRVHIMDVGQGEAVLLKTDEHAVLVDGGHSRDAVADYLRQRGISRVDIMVATHPHTDHINGLTGVIERKSVGTIWYNGQRHDTRTFKHFQDAISAAESVYYEPDRDSRARLGHLQLEVLHPERTAAGYDGPVHDYNIVLRASYGEFAMILTGDIEHAGELEMVHSGQDIQADVLQLGHHGSRTSTHRDFVAAVAPSTAFYQAGVNNRYGHPHPEPLAVLNAAGVQVYGTDSHGHIVLTARRDGAYQIATEREGTIALPDAAAACVDLNHASADQLTRIIHIGPARARAIINGRPWASINALQRIRGLGPARLRDIREQGLAC